MTQLVEAFKFTPGVLYEHVESGLVNCRVHPVFPELSIFNYSEKAAFEREWNTVTLACRGLILNTETWEVVARPFGKFFNFDEAHAPMIKDDQKLYHWADKVDGSLGIIYKNPDGVLEVATRGSFESDQAIHASYELLGSEVGIYEEYEYLIRLGQTPLVEIIYPENRIVIDYGEEDSLVDLGSIVMEDGMFIPPAFVEPRTFGDLLQDLSRSNSEGWVAWSSAFKAVKIKQADYVALHRIVTGLNKKSVWRALRAGEPTFRAMQEQLPDELFKWAEDAAQGLREAFVSIMREADHWLWEAREAAWGDDDNYVPTRAEFAGHVKNIVPKFFQGYVFSLFDGRDISDKVWSSIEPVGGDR